ncbi:MAG: polyphosphate kinase 1 [Eubacterium sp.]|jgi:polyphosphate kinase 1
MQENITVGKRRYEYTQNRELSWLRFNKRVIEEAEDKSNPLLERLKFISIFCSDLDEFFMVRVGSLFDVSQLSPEEIDNKTGMTSFEQLRQIYNTVPGLIALKHRLYTEVMSELKAFGVEDVEYSQLTADESRAVGKTFRSVILPVLSPIIIGTHHPVPHFRNKELYVAALLRSKKGKTSLGIVGVPASLKPYLALDGSRGRFIRTENILMHWAPTLFGSYQADELCVFSVTRNADISFDDEKFEDSEEDFRNRVTKLLKKRSTLAPVRLEISHTVSEGFLSMLSSMIGVEPRQIYIDTCPLNMHYVFGLADILPEGTRRRLLYEPYKPRWPEDLSRKKSMIEQIQKKDRMLFFPFDSVDPFLKLLNEAADREDVVSIKITIYRLALYSKVAQTLCRAAENGKEVIVMMELRARFDEANNVAWSKQLENAGCQIIYGIEDFKCHSKVCLITMRGRGRMTYVTQIGTGNYNENTNKQYTDLSFMTASDKIGEDATVFFQNLLINNLDGKYEKLLVSPRGIKEGIIRGIDREMAKGKDGYVCIKANSVTERDVIDKLREASQAGVEIEMIIRGICCILPGVRGETDNIKVTSIVGRFLEHARIYRFGRGDDAEYYISSADLMTRNLDRRVEVACPITDPRLKEQLKWILETELADNVKASLMMPDGRYVRKTQGNAEKCSSQERFMQVSMHHEEPEDDGETPESKRETEGLAAHLKKLFHFGEK